MPLNKPLKLNLLTIIVSCIFEEDGKFYLTIIVSCIFEEDGKFYPQLYLDDCINARIQ